MEKEERQESSPFPQHPSETFARMSGFDFERWISLGVLVIMVVLLIAVQPQNDLTDAVVDSGIPCTCREEISSRDQLITFVGPVESDGNVTCLDHLENVYEIQCRYAISPLLLQSRWARGAPHDCLRPFVRDMGDSQEVGPSPIDSYKTNQTCCLAFLSTAERVLSCRYFPGGWWHNQDHVCQYARMPLNWVCHREVRARSTWETLTLSNVVRPCFSHIRREHVTQLSHVSRVVDRSEHERKLLRTESFMNHIETTWIKMYYSYWTHHQDNSLTNETSCLVPHTTRSFPCWVPSQIPRNISIDSVIRMYPIV